MKPQVVGLGRAVPRETLDQREALQLAEACCAGSVQEADRLRRLFEHSGVESRRFVVARPDAENEAATEAPASSRARSVGEATRARVPFFPPRLHDEDRGPTTAERLGIYDEWAGVLACLAATQALADSGRDASRVTHLVTVSCTGMRSPGVDVALIEALGLPRGVRRAHVGFMGCHAAINALRLASDSCLADPRAVVLVVCVELCSVHFQYRGRGDHLLANALFADGAGAAVVAMRDSEPGAELSLLDFASVVVPDSQDCMSWCVGDHGFEMSLSIDVPARIRASVRPWLSEWLARHELSIGNVGSWAVHPGGPRILDAFAQALSLDSTALGVSRQILARFGNMSSPTVLFILDELRGVGAGQPIVAIAFGPGLTIEAALLGSA